METFLSLVCYGRNITVRGCLKIELPILQFARFAVLIPASFSLNSTQQRGQALQGQKVLETIRSQLINMLVDVTADAVLQDFHDANRRFI